MTDITGVEKVVLSFILAFENAARVCEHIDHILSSRGRKVTRAGQKRVFGTALTESKR